MENILGHYCTCGRFVFAEPKYDKLLKQGNKVLFRCSNCNKYTLAWYTKSNSSRYVTYQVYSKDCNKDTEHDIAGVLESNEIPMKCGHVADSSTYISPFGVVPCCSKCRKEHFNSGGRSDSITNAYVTTLK